MTDRQFYGKYYFVLIEKQGLIYRDLLQVTKEHPGVIIYSRIKNAASMAEKLRSRNLPADARSAILRVNDALGFRIICSNVKEVYDIADWIRGLDSFDIIRKKDYILFPKKNGYRSLHLIGKMQDGFTFEIQIRTKEHHLFAEIEHMLFYKKILKSKIRNLTYYRYL